MKKVFFISFFILFTVISSADEKIFRKKEIKFINELYNSGRYFDCIAETEKIQMEENNPEIEYFIFSNYYLAGQYETVINNYVPDMSSEEMQFKSLLLLSGSFFKKGRYLDSYKTLKKVEYEDLPENFIFTMFLRRVEPLVATCETGMIDRELEISDPFLKDNFEYRKLRNELMLYKNNGIKNPTYAAMMSAVLPGLGQCYSGYLGEGIISFAAVVAAAAGGLYMRDSGEKGFSYTLFFFSGLFYGGNIYGACNSAMKVNNAEFQSRRNSITSQYGSYNPGDCIDVERVFH